MITFCLYDKIHCVIHLIKFPNYVWNFSKRLLDAKAIFCNLVGNWLIVKIVNFFWPQSIIRRILLAKVMSYKGVINSFVWFVTINLMINFCFLWRKHSQAWNFLHFWFPFFEIRKIVKLINNPIENDNIAAF